MIEDRQQSVMKLAAMVLIILVGTIAIVSVYNPKKQPAATPVETIAPAEGNAPAAKTTPSNDMQFQAAPTRALSPNNVQLQSAAPQQERKMRLNDIVRLRQTWGPILTAWYGEDAPDFTAADITGKEHKLSDYRGRTVMLVFWATWCGPCVSEIPSLMALRSTVSGDKLAILAVSNERPDRLKRFATGRKLNYTVISQDTFSLSRPYNEVRGIPTSFFIDPKGKIKIVTEGVVPLEDMRAILETD